jgi:hypothetical protein
MISSLSRALLPAIALCGAFACISLVGLPTTGCIDVADGSASSSGVDAGEGGTSSADANTGLVWGCADNGTECDCYSPAAAQYTQTQCITYSCCYTDSYVTETGLTQHVCQCANDVSCISNSQTAQRVSGCPH